MKKILTFTLLIYGFISINAQTKFEKGYFINNSGERIECFIENLDLLYNPKGFTYKLTASSKEKEATIKDVNLFEIYKTSKYERHIVNIDRSSEIIEKISENRKAKFDQEQLFLKVLLEGKASLYQYKEPNLSRFFYSSKESDIQQLVFKSYSDSFDNSIKKNERYKQQILINLDCKSVKKERIKKLKYQKEDLVNLFIEYNNCTGLRYTNYTLKDLEKLKSNFNLNLKTGVNFPFLNFLFAEFERKAVARFGLEAEFIMGFNNNKWAFIIEPNYLYYSSEYNDTTTRINEADNSAQIDYKAIDIPIGIRHYMFLNKKSKFFINALVVPSITIKSKIRSTGEIVSEPLNYDGQSDINCALGIGYKYNDKLSLELRGSTPRDLLNSVGGPFTEAFFYNSSIIIGYTFF